MPSHPDPAACARLLDRGERLHFVFQPIVDMARGEIFGDEAFMRDAAGPAPAEPLAGAVPGCGGCRTDLVQDPP
jgi:hypothetical protein